MNKQLLELCSVWFYMIHGIYLLFLFYIVYDAPCYSLYMGKYRWCHTVAC